MSESGARKQPGEEVADWVLVDGRPTGQCSGDWSKKWEERGRNGKRWAKKWQEAGVRRYCGGTPLENGEHEALSIAQWTGSATNPQEEFKLRKMTLQFGGRNA